MPTRRKEVVMKGYSEVTAEDKDRQTLFQEDDNEDLSMSDDRTCHSQDLDQYNMMKEDEDEDLEPVHQYMGISKEDSTVTDSDNDQLSILQRLSDLSSLDSTDRKIIALEREQAKTNQHQSINDVIMDESMKTESWENAQDAARQGRQRVKESEERKVRTYHQGDSRSSTKIMKAQKEIGGQLENCFKRQQKKMEEAKSKSRAINTKKEQLPATDIAIREPQLHEESNDDNVSINLNMIDGNKLRFLEDVPDATDSLYIQKSTESSEASYTWEEFEEESEDCNIGYQKEMYKIWKEHGIEIPSKQTLTPLQYYREAFNLAKQGVIEKETLIELIEVMEVGNESQSRKVPFKAIQSIGVKRDPTPEEEKILARNQATPITTKDPSTSTTSNNNRNKWIQQPDNDNHQQNNKQASTRKAMRSEAKRAKQKKVEEQRKLELVQKEDEKEGSDNDMNMEMMDREDEGSTSSNNRNDTETDNEENEEDKGEGNVREEESDDSQSSNESDDESENESDDDSENSEGNETSEEEESSEEDSSDDISTESEDNKKIPKKKKVKFGQPLTSIRKKEPKYGKSTTIKTKKKLSKKITKKKKQTMITETENSSRFTMKIKSSYSKDMVKATKKTREAIIEVFETLLVLLTDNQEYRNAISIWPWKEGSTHCHIYKANQIPESIMGMQEYFPKLYNASKTKTDLFTKIRIGHKMEQDKILQTAGSALRDNQHSLFLMTVQCEELVNCGWLLFSHGDFDLKKLQHVMSEVLQLPIGLRNKVILVEGQAYKPTNTRAIHIEVDKNDYCKARKELQRWLGGKKGSKEKSLTGLNQHQRRALYPLGISLRYIQENKHHCNMEEKEKTKKLVKVQSFFQEGIEQITIDTITNLDSFIHEEKNEEGISEGKGQVKLSRKMTLRNMIMELSPKERPGEPLFHAIFEKKDQQGVFTVFASKVVAREAEMVLNSLYTILHHKYDESIESSFTPDAIFDAEDKKYDPETGTVKSTYGNTLDDVLDNEGSYMFENLRAALDQEEAEAEEIKAATEMITSTRKRRPVPIYGDASVDTIKTTAGRGVDGAVDEVAREVAKMRKAAEKKKATKKKNKEKTVLKDRSDSEDSPSSESDSDESTSDESTINEISIQQLRQKKKAQLELEEQEEQRRKKKVKRNKRAKASKKDTTAEKKKKKSGQKATSSGSRRSKRY